MAKDDVTVWTCQMDECLCCCVHVFNNNIVNDSINGSIKSFYRRKMKKKKNFIIQYTGWLQLHARISNPYGRQSYTHFIIARWSGHIVFRCLWWSWRCKYWQICIKTSSQIHYPATGIPNRCFVCHEKCKQIETSKIDVFLGNQFRFYFIFFSRDPQAFLDIDEALLNAEELKHEMGGSTAVVTLMKDNKLYCANAGDSRAIACVNGQVSSTHSAHYILNKIY